MDHSPVGIEQLGRVTRITIRREVRRNALDRMSQEALSAALDEFAADDSQWVAIITGAGDRAFCAGHDLKTAAPEGSDGLLPEGFGGLTARFDLVKPVIAAVNGAAYGGGFEMVLACDIVIAAQRATFALPEVRVGMAALGGGILRLSRMVPHQQAMGMILTGQPVTAERGREMGFVTEVVPDEDLQAAALRWAEAIVAASPMAVRASKRVALDCASDPLAEANRDQWELPAVRDLHGSDDWIEGPRAFVERRPPQWRGR